MTVIAKNVGNRILSKTSPFMTLLYSVLFVREKLSLTFSEISHTDEVIKSVVLQFPSETLNLR